MQWLKKFIWLLCKRSEVRITLRDGRSIDVWAHKSAHLWHYGSIKYGENYWYDNGYFFAGHDAFKGSSLTVLHEEPAHA